MGQHWRHRCRLAALGVAALLAAPLRAQHAPSAEQKPAAPTPGAGPGQKGAPEPTHAPRPTLPPLLAWQHVRRGNDAAAQALAAGKSPPGAPERPAGAGRYVCAVLVCADCDVDIPQLLGLQRKDVLLLGMPGPFVQPEVVALLEQAVAAERLSLILVLSHDRCTTLASRPGQSHSQDALARRITAVRAEAQRTGQSLSKTLPFLQREQLLAASEQLEQEVERDALRVMPGELDTRSGAILWHNRRADELPLHPVR